MLQRKKKASADILLYCFPNPWFSKAHIQTAYLCWKFSWFLSVLDFMVIENNQYLTSLSQRTISTWPHYTYLLPNGRKLFYLLSLVLLSDWRNAIISIFFLCSSFFFFLKSVLFLPLSNLSALNHSFPAKVPLMPGRERKKCLLCITTSSHVSSFKIFLFCNRITLIPYIHFEISLVPISVQL